MTYEVLLGKLGIWPSVSGCMMVGVTVCIPCCSLACRKYGTELPLYEDHEGCMKVGETRSHANT